MLPLREIEAAMLAHLVRYPQTSFQKQVGDYMRSENLKLACVQPPTSSYNLQIACVLYNIQLPYKYTNKSGVVSELMICHDLPLKNQWTAKSIKRARISLPFLAIILKWPWLYPCHPIKWRWSVFDLENGDLDLLIKTETSISQKIVIIDKQYCKVNICVCQLISLNPNQSTALYVKVSLWGFRNVEKKCKSNCFFLIHF